MTYQRNIGLEAARSEVVLFPDDDSLFYPDSMARVMKIYDLDGNNLVGGVGAGEALTPPPGVLPKFKNAYEKKTTDKLKAAVSPLRYALETRFAPDPFVHVAAQKQSRLPSPPVWLDDKVARPVPWFTGFRMSFRTAILRTVRFDEQLGRYALFEDTDVGFSIQDHHYPIGVRFRGVYHHNAPIRRSHD